MNRLLLSALVSTFFLAPARAELKLPDVIGNDMVLQRDRPIVIWGLADPDEEVIVEFATKSQKAKANDEGKWIARLEAVEANAEPQTLTVTGRREKLERKRILVGDVWVGSGQSNMEWSVRQSADAEKTIKAADHPKIRLCNVPRQLAREPAFNIKASWKVCTPETVPNFSAVLYHFGVEIRKKVDVPIGLINASWGGSAIEPWLWKEKEKGKEEDPSGGMYLGMVAPWQRLGLRGVLWYQGESNVSDGLAYSAKMKELIEGWRKVRGDEKGKETPFYFVQLAPWSRYKTGALPPLWEAQAATLKLPNTGMVVTTDLVDDINDIHPAKKAEVGERLARWARVKTYGEKDLVYSGPLYKSMKIDGDKVRLSFAHVGGGLKSRDDKPLTGFEITSDGVKFFPAEAKIDGDTVVVSSKEVLDPKYVRFGWSNKANPNLMNKERLPASPFQTNDWKGGTGE